jgi:hypothetical protein
MSLPSDLIAKFNESLEPFDNELANLQMTFDVRLIVALLLNRAAELGANLTHHGYGQVVREAFEEALRMSQEPPVDPARLLHTDGSSTGSKQ